MKKLSTLLFIFCCISGFSQTVDITFNVNMEYQTVAETGVFIAGGGNFGNPGENELTDPDGDGVYSITLTKESGFSSFFTFTNGACPDYSCKENLAGQPCGDPANFNDRFLPEVTENISLDFCFGQCSTDGTCVPPAAPVDVTFSVDMSEQTVPGEMYITGADIDGWCGNCTAMEDTDGDGIYTITLSLEPGNYEYKYNNGGWDGTETLDPAEDANCTLTTGDFTNRYLELPVSSEPVILETNCFAACGECEPSTGDMVDITFNVNTENITVSDAGLFIAGGGNFGNPGDNQLTDTDGDGVYTITVTKEMGFSSFFIFTNGACPDYSCKENLAGQPCGDPENFNDRFLPAVNSNSTFNFCYEQCSTDGSCEGIADPVDVTFSVDMNDQVVMGDVYVTGAALDNWCGTCLAMDDSDGDGVYTYTIALAPGSYEYKYNNGSWDDTEILDATEDAECTLTTGDFTNRIVEITGTEPVTLDVNCFAACGACAASVSDFAQSGFSLNPSLADETTVLTFSNTNTSPRTLRLYSLSGAMVGQHVIGAEVSRYEIYVGDLDSGLYMVSLEVEGRQSVTKLVVGH